MTAQIKAELLKVRSTRTTVGLLAGMTVLTLLIVILSGLLSHPDALASQRDQLNLFGNGGVALIFSSLAGVLLITSEYRYGTIHPTLLFTPRRRRVLTAKLTAGLLAGLAFGAAAIALALGIGSLMLAARGIPSALHGRQIALLIGGGLAGIALRGALGVGLGALVRNLAAAIAAALAWIALIEGIAGQLLGSGLARWLPFYASQALDRTNISAATRLLPQWEGGVVLLGYAAAFAAAAVITTLKRDVT